MFLNDLSQIFSLAFAITIVIFIIISPNLQYIVSSPASGLSYKSARMFDSNFKAELLFEKEIKTPPIMMSPVTSMTFLGPSDILLLIKNNGTVWRIVDGNLLEKPLLDVSVANKRERGLLGIATADYSKSNNDNHNSSKYVFLYFTESNKDGNDVCPTADYCIPGNDPLGNRLYRYELKENKLINPKLLLDLPSSPGPAHNGGVIKIGPDNNVYVTIGDLLGSLNKSSSTQAQNFENGTKPDGRSGILRVTQDGRPVGHGILGPDDPLNKYYAYGIRNSFGIDFDP